MALASIKFVVLACVVVGAHLYAAAARHCTYCMSQKTLAGSPRYTWLMALPLQGCVLPGVAGMAWWMSGLPVSLWLFADRGNLRCDIWHDLFLYLFFGYMMKDFACRMALEFWLHHVTCAVVTLYFLFCEDCTGIYIAAATVLELGSTTNTIHVLWPGGATLMLHVAGMTISNISGLVLLTLYFMKPAGECVGLLTLVGGLLILCRQYFCMRTFLSAMQGRQAWPDAAGGGKTEA